MRPPLRYIATAVVFVVLVVLFLATYHLPLSAPGHDVASASVGHSINLVDRIFNSTLGFEKILAVSLPERTDRRDGLILASAVSNVDVDFVDGIHGDTVTVKALPPGANKVLHASSVGSWRAHLNAVARVVYNNYTSALIMEDDVDWDVRLKSLLKDFALSSHALAKNPDAGNLDFNNLPDTMPPIVSPYGDDWDLLWLGHCGMHLPAVGLVVHSDDSSVPEPQHLHSWDENERTPLGLYPAHTRVVMRQSTTPVCSLVYAVSQRGARQLLYSLGLKKLDAPYDVMLRAWCQGSDGNTPHVCPGVLPQLFDHYRRRGPKNADSDISDPNQDYRDNPETLNIRYSVRMNMEKLARGDSSYDDQYPDSE